MLFSTDHDANVLFAYDSAMNAVDLIAAKRDSRELTREQIDFLIDEFVRETVPDYQMAAFAMAVLCRGMTKSETHLLTSAMLESGSRMKWPDGPPVVDKHSTGGVGDKVSLVLAPLLAACGFRVPMISGRGLGPTGGTLDKLESIPGFRTDLSIDELQDVVSRVGCVITGATKDIAPADRKLYALRDVTATVPSIPLITSSIMSKKLAESLDSLVLDVKVGSGAFMKSEDDAQQLCKSLVSTGHNFGVRTTAVTTNMDQPLGRACGNLLEVAEAIECLQGGGPDDLRTVVIELAAILLRPIADGNSPHEIAVQAIESGRAFESFQHMVVAQGGDLDRFTKIDAVNVTAIESTRSGFVARVDTEAIGRSIIELGGGRRTVGDRIDHAVGVVILKKIGERVENNEPMLEVHHRAPDLGVALKQLTSVITIQDTIVSPPELIGRTFNAP